MTFRVADLAVLTIRLWRVTGRRIATGASLILLIGCTTVPIAPSVAQAQQAVSDDESQLFYELLVAELAIRRGELQVAAEGYLRATDRRDPGANPHASR